MQTEPAGRRAVFLDFDGTYADRGRVPPEHEEIVRRARAAGHLVLLCTGRPRSAVPAPVREVFDGMVGSAGGYVELDGEILADRRFPEDVTRRAVAVLDRHDVAYLLEAPAAIYGPPGVDRRLTEVLGSRLRSSTDDDDGPADLLGHLQMPVDRTTVRFGKITCFDSSAPIATLAAEIGPEVDVLPSSIPGMGESAGEIFLRGLHKAVGVEVVMARLGLPREAVVAVGDGPNDLEMLALAGVGVAIEGAEASLLAVADRSAAGPERTGLVALFGELGLV